MSADNGIYILETINRNESVRSMYPHEYRVAHLQAVENYRYDEEASDPNIFVPEKKDYADQKYHSVDEYMPENTKHLEWQMAYNAKVHSDDSKVHIKNARKMWNDTVVFYTRQEALNYADHIYKEIMGGPFPVLEYGISFITINEVF